MNVQVGQVVTGVVAVVPAKDEEERVGRTIAALQRIPSVMQIVLVDDGSSDQTAAVVEWTGGVDVVRHERNRGKAAAMESGVRRARQLAPGAPVLFADADLEDSAEALGVIVEPVLAAEADLAIGVLPPQDTPGGGFGIVVRTAREGIIRLTGWAPQQPLSGQRCLSPAALEAALPFAPGWGVEVGMTVDVLRAGLVVVEVPCELRHRVTGRDLSSQVHRARQLADVTRVLADRSGLSDKVREGGIAGGRAVRSGAVAAARLARPVLGTVAQRGGPLVGKTVRTLRGNGASADAGTQTSGGQERRHQERRGQGRQHGSVRDLRGGRWHDL
ncbi:glycosyltransferase family 2 protein [Ornithinimicrobium sp. Y1847]|uniref:glycosyltransferase family 2 protein n=1 Tax=Ornithinimicrobium sp. Y1847 TaxID=3405419 RepID=UPI003B67B900